MPSKSFICDSYAPLPRPQSTLDNNASYSREAQLLDERRSSFIPAVQEALSTCSLRKIAEAEISRLQLSSPQKSFWTARKPERARNTDGTNDGSTGDAGRFCPGQQSSIDDGDTIDDKNGVDPLSSHRTERSGDDTRDCAEAARAVRLAECTAAVAEREYASRARGLVRLRAATSLQNRCSDNGRGGVPGTCASSAGEREASRRAIRKDAAVSERLIEGVRSGKAYGSGGFVLGCGGCAVLFEANERLLEEARARGFLR